LGRLRNEAKAYLQALKVGSREAPTAPKGKRARQKELAGFFGDTRMLPPPCRGERPSAAERSHFVARESKGKTTRKILMTQVCGEPSPTAQP